MPHTLLVADESLTIQRLVHLTFATHDVHVVGVPDGEQAMSYLASARPDIALISVTLPRVDGFEVAAHMGREPRLRGVPLLFLAGAFDLVDEARVRDAGAAGVFFKPFEPDHLINRVKELLGLSRPRDGAPSRDASVRLVPPPTAARAATQTMPLHMGEEWAHEDTVNIAAQAGAATKAAAAATATSGPPEPPRAPVARSSTADRPIGAAGDVTQVPKIEASQNAIGEAPRRAKDPEVEAPPRSAEPTAPTPPPAVEAASRRSEPPTPASVAAPVFGPADAFAALLAEEQGETVAPVVTQPVVELSDAMVERIADRVAERMMQSVFAESLRGTVHEVSERLVREEIQRIRAAAHGRL